MTAWKHGGGAVGQGEFVVAGGQTTPLLDVVEAAFDDVAPLVIGGVECRRASTAKMGLTPDGGHLTGGAAGPAGRMSVCRASVASTPRSFGSRLPAW
jgi:hypothetical protein